MITRMAFSVLHRGYIIRHDISNSRAADVTHGEGEEAQFLLYFPDGFHGTKIYSHSKGSEKIDFPCRSLLLFSSLI
jgi:hypothetical protein